MQLPTPLKKKQLYVVFCIGNYANGAYGSLILQEKLSVADVTHHGEMVLDEVEPDLVQPNCSEDGFTLNKSGSVNGNKG